MALLKNLITNQIVQLHQRHLFGSAHQWVNTLLTHKHIAPIHAAIYYEKDVWSLEKLTTSSHHRIKHNGQSVSKDTQIQLELGSTIDFARDKQQWRLINIDSPKYFLHSMHTNELYIELQQSLQLPKKGKTIVTLRKTDENQWQCQKGLLSFMLQEGSVLTFEDEIWRFTSALPTGFKNDADLSLTTQSPLFWIYVSKDEEHVKILLDYNAQRFDLGERVHHYLLLLLARKRQADTLNGYDSHTQGWVDLEDITKQLHIEPNVLNMQITRLRRQFNQFITHVPPLKHDIIERRPRQLRFAFTHFKIFHGSTLEV